MARTLQVHVNKSKQADAQLFVQHHAGSNQFSKFCQLMLKPCAQSEPKARATSSRTMVITGTSCISHEADDGGRRVFVSMGPWTCSCASNSTESLALATRESAVNAGDFENLFHLSKSTSACWGPDADRHDDCYARQRHAAPSE
jgi:hypothetical protein